MTDELPDLVPWDFAPEVVLSPEQILTYQARLIGEKSGGRLTGRIERSEIISEELERTVLGFLVEVPLIDYSTRLFQCSHDKLLPYPTTVTFQGFNPPYVSAKYRKSISGNSS